MARKTYAVSFVFAIRWRHQATAGIMNPNRRCAASAHVQLISSNCSPVMDALIPTILFSPDLHDICALLNQQLDDVLAVEADSNAQRSHALVVLHSRWGQW